MSEDLDYLLVEALSEAASLSGGSRSSTRSSARLLSPSLPSSAPTPGGVARGGGVGFGDVPEGGRFSQGLSSSKMYSVVCVRGSDSDRCFGCVGVGSASFCIRKGCGVKSHFETKASFRGNESTRVFISRKSESTVFVEPSVDLLSISDEVWEEWKSRQCTLAEWSRDFCAVGITGGDAASMEDLKEEASFLVKAKDFKTPSKRKRDLFSELEEGEGLSIPLHIRSFPPVESSEWDVLVEKGITKSMLTVAVAQIESTLIALGSVVGSMMGQNQAKSDKHDEERKMLGGAVQTLMASLGTSAELDDRFEAPTIWGAAVAFIADEVSRSGKALAVVEGDLIPLKDRLSSFVVSTAQNNKSLEESCKKTVKALVMVLNRVKEINPEIDFLKARVVVLEQEQEWNRRNAESNKSARVGMTGQRTAGASGSVDDLMEMLGNNNLESGQWGEHAPNPCPLVKDSTTEAAGVVRDTGLSNSLASTLAKTVTAVEKLVHDVGELKACVEDKSVKFGGLGLRTIHDCNDWVQTHFTSYRYGLIMDPLLMLDRIFGARDGINKSNQFKTWEARLKLKISTGAEEAAITALQYNRPQIFHTGMTEMVTARNKSKLNKLPNVRAWKSAGEGVRHFIVKRMNLMHTTMLNEIGYAFGSDPGSMKAHSLAVTSLNDTITFLTQLLNFIDTLYERLNVQSQFTPEQSWSLSTQILDRICEELYESKEGVTEAMTVEEPSSVCCHMLWACFRTHDVMAGYLEKDFENHPTISAEYVKFLATNSGFDKVEKLQVQMTEVLEKLSKSVDESKKATAKADAASTKCSELTREVAALTKKVKTLEDQRGGGR